MPKNCNFAAKTNVMQARFKLSTKKIIGLILGSFFLFFILTYQKPFVDSVYSTVVFDSEGKILGARIASDEQWKFPQTNNIAEKYYECVKQFEDQYFEYHPGINPVSIVKALYGNVKAGKIVSGGSTITMQVIRLSEKANRNYRQKMIEMWKAFQLEFFYSKKDIFQMYATHVPFGGNIVGVETAAHRYFQHSADELSWAEAATLAVLPNAPSSVNIEKNRTILYQKRNTLLHKLLVNECIDSLTYELALLEELPEKVFGFPDIAPHLIEKLHLQFKGQIVHTTIDRKIQTAAEGILYAHHKELKGNHINHIAAMVVDVKKNEIVGYCGNVKEDRSEGFWVNIIDSKRSPGSLLKPLLFYKMLADGKLLSKTLLPDLPINLRGFIPTNYINTFDGAVPANEALIRSLNIPFVELLRQCDITAFYNFLKKTGFSTLTQKPEHYGLSLILGGAEITLWDAASVYTQMARTLNRFNQEFNYSTQDLSPLSFVQKSSQQEFTIQSEPIRYEAGALYLMFETLSEVNSDETGLRKFATSRKIALKTGTSFGFRDAWSVGVTPEYVVLVWVGNASGEGRPELVGGQCAAPIVFDIFGRLPATRWFATPHHELQQTAICKYSGMKAGKDCATIDTVLEVDNTATPLCKYCTKIMVTTDLRERVYQQCSNPHDNYLLKSWFVLPPAWEYYYSKKHLEYRKLPPLSKTCRQLNTQSPMQFIYPLSKGIIRIPRKLDGSPGKVLLRLAHQNSNIQIYWYLDQEYITATQNFHEIELQPQAGRYRITAIDQEGNEIYRTLFVE